MPPVPATLTVTIARRADGTLAITTTGNPAGDWHDRTVRFPGSLGDALHALGCATDSTRTEALHHP